MAGSVKRDLTIVITGGGTGGHIFPGIAIAQEMLARNPGTRVVFIGTERKVDKHAMKEYGFETRTVKAKPLKGGGILAKLKSVCLLPVSLLESISVLRNVCPDMVFGVGGYVTGPVILAAKILGIPCCIHEQNSIPGMANRKLGGIVDKVFLSMPGSERFFPAKKCVLSGNPLREDILQAIGKKHDENEPTLVVLGGSQGAHSINMIVPKALSLIKEKLPQGFKVIHQTGSADEKKVEQDYQDAGITAQVAAFFSPMSKVYKKASVVLSRAGATTLAELTALKMPMVLIPFPFAADDHQKKNAQILVEKGAAKMILEQDLTAEKLSSELLSLLEDREERETMGRLSGELAKPQAAQVIVDHCLTMLGQTV